MTLKYSVMHSGTIIHRKSVTTAGAMSARGSRRVIGGSRRRVRAAGKRRLDRRLRAAGARSPIHQRV
jgi:hypothetical protein